MVEVQVLLVTFPGQGHINPSLQFAKRLLKLGVKVTFLVSFSVIHRKVKTTPTPEGLTFATFSDGYDQGLQPGVNIQHFMSALKTHGSKAIAEVITASSKNGQPFSHLVYTTLITWAGKMGQQFQVPSTLLWTQPATVFDIYYFYFNGYGHLIRDKCNSISPSNIELPGLPFLTIHDLPSFFLNSTSDESDFVLEIFKEHLDLLEVENFPKILVNTFNALESTSLRATEKLNLIPIGPLIPSAFLDGKDPSDTCFGADLFIDSRDYIGWLNSKDKASVVYVSFGSLSELSEPQMEEIARGLLEINRPFLWVVRGIEGKKIWCREKLEQKGMIVSWCSQVEVLSNSSLGCFVTHCGWNSSLESLSSGVPIVAFPLWTDQATNAKLIEGVWGIGVRVVANEEGIVEGNEIKRCVELVMGDGEKGEEIRKNAKKWKCLARESVKEGGSSDLNVHAFVSEIGDVC